MAGWGADGEKAAASYLDGAVVISVCSYRNLGDSESKTFPSLLTILHNY